MERHVFFSLSAGDMDQCVARRESGSVAAAVPNRFLWRLTNVAGATHRAP
jgi:hypothetical protein